MEGNEIPLWQGCLIGLGVLIILMFLSHAIVSTVDLFNDLPWYLAYFVAAIVIFTVYKIGQSYGWWGK